MRCSTVRSHSYSHCYSHCHNGTKSLHKKPHLNNAISQNFDCYCRCCCFNGPKIGIKSYIWIIFIKMQFLKINCYCCHCRFHNRAKSLHKKPNLNIHADAISRKFQIFSLLLDDQPRKFPSLEKAELSSYLSFKTSSLFQNNCLLFFFKSHKSQQNKLRELYANLNAILEWC